MNCGGALRERVAITDMHNACIIDMHNACILWHIGTDYTYIERKEKDEVVGSLPPHNGNLPF